jgi:SPW repeat
LHAVPTIRASSNQQLTEPLGLRDRDVDIQLANSGLAGNGEMTTETEDKDRVLSERNHDRWERRVPVRDIEQDDVTRSVKNRLPDPTISQVDDAKEEPPRRDHGEGARSKNIDAPAARRSRKLMMPQKKSAAMLDWTSTRETVLDIIKLVCATLLFASPWILQFTPTPTWNAWVCGYAMLTVSVAALVAEADWEPHANLWLGAWVLGAPWALGFSQETEAMVVHVVGGSLVFILSAVEIWTTERNPPWRFRPGAAQRADVSPIGDARTRGAITAIYDLARAVADLMRPSSSDISRDKLMCASARRAARPLRPATRQLSTSGRWRHQPFVHAHKRRRVVHCTPPLGRFAMRLCLSRSRASQPFSGRSWSRPRVQTRLRRSAPPATATFGTSTGEAALIDLDGGTASMSKLSFMRSAKAGDSVRAA